MLLIYWIWLSQFVCLAGRICGVLVYFQPNSVASAQIRLSRISAENMVQPAEFFWKIRLRGVKVRLRVCSNERQIFMQAIDVEGPLWLDRTCEVPAALVVIDFRCLYFLAMTTPMITRIEMKKNEALRCCPGMSVCPSVRLSVCLFRSLLYTCIKQKLIHARSKPQTDDHWLIHSVRYICCRCWYCGHWNGRRIMHRRLQYWTTMNDGKCMCIVTKYDTVRRPIVCEYLNTLKNWQVASLV